MDEMITVGEDFIEENKNNLCQFMPKIRRTGPHSRQDRVKRRNDVYLLHFDHGYSARRIADMLKVNRNTVNGDICYWYSRVAKTKNMFNPEFAITMTLQRLEIQRTRLREQIDIADSTHEMISLERLLYEIDSKILHTNHKLGESTIRILKLSNDKLNHWLRCNKKEERFLSLFDRVSVSDKAKERIDKIMKDDLSRRVFL